VGQGGDNPITMFHGWFVSSRMLLTIRFLCSYSVH
jgi:hypothetical protein